jgi:hypothetical protein
VNWQRFHLWATVVWAFLGVPTLLSWQESIIWIAIMSWYANVVGHWGAYQAARSENNDVEIQGQRGPVHHVRQWYD